MMRLAAIVVWLAAGFAGCAAPPAERVSEKPSQSRAGTEAVAANQGKPLPHGRVSDASRPFHARPESSSRPHLFGCGIIWAEWKGSGDHGNWAWDGRCMDRIKAMGGTAVPINIPWHDVEPEPGRWYFDYVDHQVAEAEKRGLAMYAYMGLTPDWALPPEAPKDMPGIGYRFPPPDERAEQFITYCRKVAERYKGRVKHYQFWNEPNGCSWVNDGCANGHIQGLYVKWLKTWYTAMKQIDPDAMLAVGGLDYHEGVEGDRYIEGMYREGAKGYFDAMMIHPYGITAPLYYQAIEDARRVMDAHGDADKPIWIREYGWALEDEDEKARRLAETLQGLADPKYDYVTMAMYLSLTDPGGEVPFGFCDLDLEPRKSYFAFQRVATGADRPSNDRQKGTR